MCGYTGIPSYTRITIDIKSIDATRYKLDVNFDIDECDGIYEQYLLISIDDPNIILSPLQCSVESTLRYAPAFKDTKSLFMGPCTLSGMLDAPTADHFKTAQLYVTYHLFFAKHSTTIVLPLSNTLPKTTVDRSMSSGRTVEETSPEKKALNLETNSPLIEKFRKNNKTDYYPVLPEPVEGSTGFEAAPPLIPLGTLSLMCMLIGLILLFKGSYARRRTWWHSIAAILGMALIACSFVVAAKAYQAQYAMSHSLHK